MNTPSNRSGRDALYHLLLVHVREAICLSATIAALLSATSLQAATDLKRGDPAPPIVLDAVDGTRIDTTQMRGESLLVLFGEAGQDKTEKACRLIGAALDSPILADHPIKWILVLSRSSDLKNLDPEVLASKRRPIVVHDTQRQVFGAYRTVVLPTAIIVDRRGRVVHALAGLTPRFGDTIFDALLVAAGTMTIERFDQNLRGLSDKQPDEQHRRGERFTQFAKRLVQRGMTSLAEAKYREAIELVPDLTLAQLGLAALLVQQQRLDEAATLYRAVLAHDPQSNDAALGLAFIQLTRDTPLVEEAEAFVRSVLERAPSRARAHYLLGLIHEQRGDAPAAAASYRIAAELLLKRFGSIESIASGPSTD